MAYQEQESRTSKTVVETPVSRREVTHTDAVRGRERDGVSGTTVGVIVVVAIALITILVLLLMNNQATNENINANLAAQAAQQPPPTTVVQQPAQQPPVIIQQAPAAPAQAPIVITQPAPSSGSTSSGSTSSGSNDSAIQSEIDKRINDDPTYSTLGLTVTVIEGKATVIGTVKSDSLKSQVERMIRSVRGVKDIDNQLIVSG